MSARPRLSALRVGSPAPDFSLPTTRGNTFTLSKQRGVHTLLIFLRHLG